MDFIMNFKENLYLTNETGKRLFERYAKDCPIIDYHCHLIPQRIAENERFSDLGELWLYGDHYKWRAMRTFGIDEELITGSRSYYDKFMAFASIIPKLIGNPIYIWCALELKRLFDIDEPLSFENADRIFNETKRVITERDYTPKKVMELFKVECAGTTDDPADDLIWHSEIKKDKDFLVKVLPSYRPDKAISIEKTESFCEYIPKLSDASGVKIHDFSSMMEALEQRLIFFKSLGCVASDHALLNYKWVDYSAQEIDQIFALALSKKEISETQRNQYYSAFLFEMHKRYHKHSIVSQLHFGVERNVNSKMFDALGADTGYDIVGDSESVKGHAALLDRLNTAGALPKIIIYPIHMGQYEQFAILATAFCKEGRGHIQLGAPWWFGDQAYGIRRQFDSISNLYPLSLSVGMLTDSRSFLSYPRHELYRRILCDYLGAIVERGEYFSSEEELGQVVKDICYYNAKAFFGL